MTAKTHAPAVDLAQVVRQHAHRLGEPAQYRIWSTAPRSSLNAFRRREFTGWLVGWGDGNRETAIEEISMVEPQAVDARTEVSVYLTTDGRLITTVNLLLGERRTVFDSAPDQWATYGGDHGTLAAAANWLDAVRRELTPAIAPEAIDAALEHAERVIVGAPQ